MHLKDIKQKAIELRKSGYSYSYISKQLSVAKSTLSVWLKGERFVPNDFSKQLVARGQKKSIEYKRVDKANSLIAALRFAEENVGKLSKREIFILGMGIYIGEGSKSGNFVRISNSDPRIIRFSILWFKECFSLKDLNFKIRIHIYPDTDEAESIKFWMREVGLSKEHFHPAYVDRRLNKKAKKSNVLPYGTAHLSVVSNGNKELGVLLHRKILASIDRVLLRD